ncbi:unnamed protein product, partial [Musa hybrid cultivar]
MQLNALLLVVLVLAAVGRGAAQEPASAPLSSAASPPTAETPSNTPVAAATPESSAATPSPQMPKSSSPASGPVPDATASSPS